MKLKYNATPNISIRQWFREHYMNLTYTELQRHLRIKNITLNGKKAPPQQILNDGDIIYVWDKVEKQENVFDNTKNTIDESTILFHDENMLVINKPYNICSQGDKDNSTFLQAKNFASQINQYAYPVHRLDKLTTGVLVFALNRNTAMLFSQSIHTWDKQYIALLPSNDLKSGTIETYEDDKKLITKYRTIAKNDKYNIVEFSPITGKKHQIRKHAAYLGYPVIGDMKYGSEFDCKLYLHCNKITLTLEKEFTFQAHLPKHMEYFAQYI
ncbi:RluA family pseudouridine synthase [Candidatus Cytomitobacter primus]|uniref:RluA family pseudouridine synthase n=1 Tax=Candidatus Cytomitobacter primus TaxID=2066024 RepID=A0A5C0UF82_9PROT|nr:RluA family pseudouridine synthase [Candidatus Cytomitobacter primus]QEK38377.1 RluA family pseudouridine synthase [Candidatus Cytomitobacter primus]